MVAPKYAEKRSQLAKKIGLGTKGRNMKRKAAGKK
jgi:predicted transcriptional regulator